MDDKEKMESLDTDKVDNGDVDVDMSNKEENKSEGNNVDAAKKSEASEDVDMSKEEVTKSDNKVDAAKKSEDSDDVDNGDVNKEENKSEDNNVAAAKKSEDSEDSVLARWRRRKFVFMAKDKAHLAASMGDLDGLKQFMQQNNYGDKEMSEILHNSASCKTSADCLRYLIEQDVTRLSIKSYRDTMSLLMTAGYNGSLVCVEELLKYEQTDLNSVNRFGQTALMTAADKVLPNEFHGDKRKMDANQENDLKICRLLIQSGVDVNLRDDHGHLVLHHACSSGSEFATALVEIVLPLTKYDKKSEAELEESIMQLAIQTENYATLQVLLKFPNDFVVPNKDILEIDFSLYSRLSSLNLDYPGILSNIGLLFENIDFKAQSLFLDILNEMIDLGWTFNSQECLTSEMAVFCVTYGNHLIKRFNAVKSINNKDFIREMAKIFSKNGAFLRMSEANRVLGNFHFDESFACILKIFCELGLIPLESLLEMDWNSIITSEFQIMSAVGYVSILNDNFGNQGQFNKKIEEAFNIKTHYDVMREKIDGGEDCDR